MDITGLTVLVGYLAFVIVRFVRRRSVWRRLVDRFSIDLGGPGKLKQLTIQGRTPDGLRVYVAPMTYGKFWKRKGLQYMVHAADGLPDDLTLHPRGERLMHPSRGSVFSTGDAIFDGVVQAFGEGLAARAALTQDARAASERFVGTLKGTVETTGAHLSDESGDHGYGTMEATLRAALDTMRALRAKGDASGATRLAKLAQTDPVPGVRAEALHALAQAGPQRKTTLAALRRGLRDKSAFVRVQAAELLGPDGHRPLAELVGAADVADVFRARALRSLMDRAPDLVAQHLPLWLADAGGLMGAPVVAAEMIRAVATLELAELRPILHGVAAGGPPGVQIEAARSLARLGPAPGTEQALLAILRSADDEAATAGALALGIVGGRLAVAPLLARAKGWLVDDDLERAVEQAVAGIQGRIQGAGAGQLALSAEDEAGGALAIADEAGDLSLTEDAPELVREEG